MYWNFSMKILISYLFNRPLDTDAVQTKTILKVTEITDITRPNRWVKPLFARFVFCTCIRFIQCIGLFISIRVYFYIYLSFEVFKIRFHRIKFSYLMFLLAFLFIFFCFYYIILQEVCCLSRCLDIPHCRH